MIGRFSIGRRAEMVKLLLEPEGEAKRSGAAFLAELL